MKFVNYRVMFNLYILLIIIASFETKSKTKITSKNKSLFEMNKTLMNIKEMKFYDKFSSNKIEKTQKLSNLLKKSKLNQQIDNRSGNVFQGWLKYLEISDDKEEIPNNFIKNKMFYLQMSENPSMNTISKDNMGYLNIPNEQYFWFELDNINLNIFNSRNPRYRKKENCLKISDLVPEITMHPCKGGVEDVGNFIEGYCFMLKFLKYSKHYIWEVCSEQQLEKDQWMNKITQIQHKNNLLTSNNSIKSTLSIPPLNNGLNSPSIFNNQNFITHSMTHIINGISIGNNNNQFNNGWAPSGDWSQCSQPCGNGNQRRQLKCLNMPHCLGPDFEDRLCHMKACKRELEDKMENLQKIADGNWELLGNWSSCSKSCGGGSQSIERKCLSQNCSGDNYLNQPCNINPCSSSNNNNNNNFMLNNMNIVDPLNRNSVEECRMIEGNLNLSNNSNNGINGNGMLNSHIILTSNHLDIFPINTNQNNLNYSNQSPQHSIILSHITDIHQLSNSNNNQDNNCFKIKDDTGNNLDLCGNTSNNAKDWMRKVEDYRTKCNNKILEKITSDIEHCLTPANAELKLNTISKQVMDEQSNLNRNKGFLLEKQFQEFQNQIRDLLNKEDTYELNLENQEKERIQNEKFQMHELVTKEETRTKNLINEMSFLKNNDNNYEIKEKAIKRKMKNMMEDIQKQINQKRSHLIDKLERMRRMHEIEQKIAAKKLIEIKKQVGNELTNMNKKGSPDKCFTIKNVNEMAQFCALAYHDVDLQNECKNPKQFCYMCCDIEIGINNKDTNNCCYNRCDMLKKQNSCNEFFDIYHIDEINIFNH